MERLKNDPRFVFFAAGALLALLISAPFTFAIVAPFHQGGEALSPGWWVGGILSAGLVLLLEAGAVGAKIARVGWLSVGLLGLTFIGNLVTGSDYWSRAALVDQPMLSSWRASWFGWLPPVLYAAIVPVLLYTFLHFAIERADVLLSGRRRGLAEEVRTLSADVRSISAAVLEIAQSQRSPLALPDQAVYARPEEVRTQPVLTPDFICDGCGSEATAHQRRGYAQHKAWVCKGCGKRHTAL
jgi:hypothetical protein